MNDLRDEMAKAIDGAINQLAHIRGVRRPDAAVAVAASYAENLHDSRGTSMEAYWQGMARIADGIASQETGSR